MMARANLGQLLGNVGENAAPVEPNAQPAVTAEASKPAMPAVAAKAAKRPSRATPAIDKQAAEPSAADTSTAAYLRFVRKETRLREDQQNQLTVQARRLNRAKKNQGPRITEDSLIRVAVDLFLAQSDRALGDDEDAIRKSMSR